MPILGSELATQHMPHIDQPIDGGHGKKLTVLGSGEGREWKYKLLVEQEISKA